MIEEKESEKMSTKCDYNDKAHQHTIKEKEFDLIKDVSLIYPGVKKLSSSLHYSISITKTPALYALICTNMCLIREVLMQFMEMKAIHCTVCT